MSAPLWTLEALKAATGGRLQGQPSASISGVAIDSRTIGVGEAFFAIKGDTFDGHDFVADALKRGAALAVVAESKLAEMPKGAALLVVVDPSKRCAISRARPAPARKPGSPR
jgi:UDP-N-acetylmuramyl pentapeptide synthase